MLQYSQLSTLPFALTFLLDCVEATLHNAAQLDHETVYRAACRVCGVHDLDAMSDDDYAPQLHELLVRECARIGRQAHQHSGADTLPSFERSNEWLAAASEACRRGTALEHDAATSLFAWLRSDPLQCVASPDNARALLALVPSLATDRDQLADALLVVLSDSTDVHIIHYIFYSKFFHY